MADIRKGQVAGRCSRACSGSTMALFTWLKYLWEDAARFGCFGGHTDEEEK